MAINSRDIQQNGDVIFFVLKDFQCRLHKYVKEMKRTILISLGHHKKEKKSVDCNTAIKQNTNCLREQLFSETGT